MKKRITVCSFLILIILTVIFTVIQAVKTYNYEVVHDDIFEGLGAAIMIIVGGFVVLYEVDLFHIVYYFLFRPKTKTKTALNILSNLVLITIFIFWLLSNTNMVLRKYEFIPYLLITLYVIIKAVYLIISGLLRTTDKSES